VYWRLSRAELTPRALTKGHQKHCTVWGVFGGLERPNGASEKGQVDNLAPFSSLMLARTVTAEVAEIHITQIDGTFGIYPEGFQEKLRNFQRRLDCAGGPVVSNKNGGPHDR
jgi:hypothetical protein